MKVYFEKSLTRSIGIDYIPRTVFLNIDFPAEVKISLWFVSVCFVLGEKRYVK